MDGVYLFPRPEGRPPGREVQAELSSQDPAGGSRGTLDKGLGHSVCRGGNWGLNLVNFHSDFEMS
jgi:hypothetical protein